MADPVRTQIRIPGDLYERLVESSRENVRSLNAEMVLRLQLSFESIESTVIGAPADNHLRLELERAAKKSGRTLSGEIANRLYESFNPTERVANEMKMLFQSISEMSQEFQAAKERYDDEVARLTSRNNYLEALLEQRNLDASE